MHDILEEMRKEAAEKAAKKAAEETAQRVTIEFATRLLASKKLTIEDISKFCGLPLSEVKALAAELTA